MRPNYRFVGMAYPGDYRSQHLDEIVATAADLSPTWSFRQSRSILVGGLRTRVLEASGGSQMEIWASGAR